MWALAMDNEIPVPDERLQLWDRVVFDGAGLSDYAVVLAGRGIAGGSNKYASIRDSVFAGYRKAGVKLTFDFHDNGPGRGLWFLQNNTWADSDPGKDFFVTNDIHEETSLAVTDGRHGRIALLRTDRCADINNAWNACVSSAAPDAPDL